MIEILSDAAVVIGVLAAFFLLGLLMGLRLGIEMKGTE